ncbi:ABC transporter substrate-binding protein [Vandammella animalimorsus]|uniref:ABC transporter substrate-binding protein n=1 Tax=Vandammella animalimorsus TaxID=2029117 RepID=A0A2A2APM5_9BURK|nr:tripartite tricarboxylate transporter substrate-binding protein [Vandammella animalimorsus]PAT39579.1 ABC transporter substrate-binding protein [Vandammella animalimorsus]
MRLAKLLPALLCSLGLLSAAGSAQAQSAATAPARQQEATAIVVPYAPGGPLDISARALADALKDAIGPTIVHNRPGAGGNIGLGQVARSTADGKTLGVGAVATLAINPWLYAQMPYDAQTAFEAVSPIARVPNVLVMNAQRAKALNIGSLQELIAYGRKNPGKLNYGSGGNGSAGHLAGELFKRMAELDAVHVPYNGASPAQLALLSQEVDFNFDNLAAASANIRSGKLIALAVTTLEASELLPGVPPMAQSLPGFAVDTWWGLVAPAGTPAEQVRALNQAVTQALQSPAMHSQLQALSATPFTASPEQFKRFIEAERQRYQGIVQAAGARID